MTPPTMDFNRFSSSAEQNCFLAACRSRLSFRRLCIFCVSVLLLAWLLLESAYLADAFQLSSLTNNQSNARKLEKPRDMRVIGLVFYGRRDKASILECYLRRNLGERGGWLDEVIWAVNTDDLEDLAYLEEIVQASRAYRTVEVENRSFTGIWKETVRAGDIYVKLDDDVVYMDDDTIPLLVDTLLSNPRSIAVSANLINSPEFNWLHYRFGAIMPYLPDFKGPEIGDLSTFGNPSWRSSGLPMWTEPEGFQLPESREQWNELIRLGLSRPPTSDNDTYPRLDHIPLHRWLPVCGPGAIAKTPIAQTQNTASGAGWWSWPIAAQQHYSLRNNLELQRKHVYYLDGGAFPDRGIWDHTGDRISINFFAIQGSSITENIDKMAAIDDDELYLTEILPYQENKRLLVHTHALASHYAFAAQKGMESTDLLARYQGYAKEMVCPGTFVDFI